MSSDTAAVPDDWFVGFHQGLAARFWRAAGAAMLDADLARVLRALDLPPGAAVLDVPCGDGRIALALARAGHRVTGVDIAPAEVERAAAAAAGLGARFLAGDLRALPVTGPFDAVVSWGNSFGYLTPEDSARSLAGMHAVLRPGGRLALESLSVAETWLPGGVAERARARVRRRAHGRWSTATTPWRAASRARSRSRTRTGTWSAPAWRTGSTRPARSCGCCARPGSPTSR